MDTKAITSAHLGYILHRILIEIRTLSYEPANVKAINLLADFAEIIPLQFINRDEDWLKSIATGMRELATIYPPLGRLYTILDMPEQEVIRTLKPNRDHDWFADNLQPTEAAS